LGLPYEQYNCFELVTLFFREGKNIELEKNPHENLHRFREKWFCDYPDIPHPTQWDVIGMQKGTLPIIEHLGIAINDTQFVHTRPRLGVCIDSFERWHNRHKKVVALYEFVG
jgi:hypothetical protein